MNASDPQDYVCLRGGLTVPLAALVVVLELERRGISIRPDGDAVVVNPREKVTDEDRERVRRWKLHILTLLAYACEPETIQ